jgi:hypothetical protein
MLRSMRRFLRLLDAELPPKVWLLRLINLTPALRHGGIAVAHT